MRYFVWLKYAPFLLISILIVFQLPFILFSPVSFFEEMTTLFGGAIVGQQAIAVSKTSLATSFSPKELLGSFYIKTFQASMEQNIKAKNPFKVPAIRLHNQLYYSLFKKSYAENSKIIIGENDFIYSEIFLIEYCNQKKKVVSDRQIEAWYAGLKKINSFFKERSQNFIYIITPSKGSYYPEHLPSNYPCERLNSLPFYTKAIKILKRNEVPYLDASDLMLKAKRQYNDLLYPRQGVHWTQLGGTLAIEALFKYLTISTDLVFPEISFQYNRVARINSDLDILLLMNMLGVPNTPVIDINVEKVYLDKSLTLALVAGSFGDQLLNPLFKLNVFSEMNFYSYLSNAQQIFRASPHEAITVYPDSPPGTAIDFAPLFSSDLVILEENEVAMNHNSILLLDKITSYVHGKLKQ